MKEGDMLPGETAFRLYDTYGFPYDLTEDALRAQSLGVDRSGFDAAMAQQRAAARAACQGSGEKASDEIWYDIADNAGRSEFTGYPSAAGEGEAIALVRKGIAVDAASRGEQVIAILTQTPFSGPPG